MRADVDFDPTVRDGRSTVGIDPPKSNWANTVDEPPYEAFAVTCGITFTFGGVRINERAAVLDDEGGELAGLFACGEMAGGLFWLQLSRWVGPDGGRGVRPDRG